MEFEILCVTMHQKDFSKIEQMNIRSNVVFANQCDNTSYEEIEFGEYKAKMISTNTRGVGINRNLCLAYASADICLFADDDVVYNDDYKDVILKEFSEHPDADIFVFNLETDSARKQIKYKDTKKRGKFSKIPWGAIRIAFRLSSIKKANVHFTTLFGGGALFPSGEDSMWLLDAKRKGLIFYVSKETIGKFSCSESSWFSGYDEKFFFSKGAFCKAMHKKMTNFWLKYYLFRYRKYGSLSKKEKKKWMKHGVNGYKKMLPFEQFVRK